MGLCLESLINKYVGGGAFRRNASLLLSGTLASIFINTLTMPILSRIYSPQQFGVLALFTSITSVAALVATGQYELAITLPEKKRSSLNLSVLAMLLTLVVCILMFLLLAVFKDTLINTIPSSNVESWLFILPLSVFVLGVSQVAYYWAIYRQGFKKLALNSGHKAIFVGIFQLLFATFIAFKDIGLIIGQVLGQLFATALLIFPFYREEKAALATMKPADIKEEGLRYKNFPIFSLPASLINMTANQLPVILLAWFFDMTIVGQFSLSQRLIGVPGSLISHSILGVFKERASRDYRETRSCRDIYIKTLRTLIRISIIPFLVIFVGVRQTIPAVLGQEWAAAGVYAQTLTVMFFFRFIASPLSYVLIVAEKQRINLLWQTCLLIFTVLSIYAGKRAGDPSLSMTAFSVSYSALYLLMLYISYRYSKQ